MAGKAQGWVQARVQVGGMDYPACPVYGIIDEKNNMRMAAFVPVALKDVTNAPAIVDVLRRKLARKGTVKAKARAKAKV